MWLDTGLCAYSVEFSPFLPDLLAVGTAQYFGIVGNGKQIVLRQTPQGLVPLNEWITKDGVYDCSWSEGNETTFVLTLN